MTDAVRKADTLQADQRQPDTPEKTTGEIVVDELFPHAPEVIWHTLTSEITAMNQPTYFQDTMKRGVFRFMRHEHFFRSLSPNTTEMKDVFCFAAPLPLLGRLAEAVFLRSYMQSLLRERNAVLKQIAESTEWQKYLPVTT